MEILGVLLGVFTIILLSLKGMAITIAAPLATFVVLLFNGMDIPTYFLGNGGNHYMGALGAYIINFFPIFLLGAILGRVMDDSGAIRSIANFILKKVGTNRPYPVMVAIFVIGLVLTYGGVSIFVVMFTLIPLSRTLFKKINISWNLIQVPLWLGVGTLTVTKLPGTPSIHNVIPIQFLNTSLTAAAIPSLIGSLGCLIFGLCYMKYTLNKSLKKGETYSEEGLIEEKNQDTKLPNFYVSLLPLMALVTIVIKGSTFDNDFIQSHVIYIALSVAIFLAFTLFFNRLPNKLSTLSQGANGSIAAVFATASAVAFGSVIVVAPGFSAFFDVILAIENPLISLTVLTSVLSAITGSSSGTLGIVMPNFAQHYLEAGVHPELIHRVATIGATILTQMPQSGVVITFLTVSKLTYKNGYKEGLITVTGGSLIAVILVITTGLLLY